MPALFPCQTYLITDGSATPETFETDSVKILDLIKRAVLDGITLVQIREKSLTGKQLFELIKQTVAITTGSSTRLLLNDRADIALAGGADGVHLTSHSLPTEIVRLNFSAGFIIGVSTHSLETAIQAKNGGADFITFSPIFPTQSKISYGAPQGVEKLRGIAEVLDGFPVFALGGISNANYQETIDAGAVGIAGISLFYEMLSAE